MNSIDRYTEMKIYIFRIKLLVILPRRQDGVMLASVISNGPPPKVHSFHNLHNHVSKC